jgi:hypothetical protein
VIYTRYILDGDVNEIYISMLFSHIVLYKKIEMTNNNFEWNGVRAICCVAQQLRIIYMYN